MEWGQNGLKTHEQVNNDPYINDVDKKVEGGGAAECLTIEDTGTSAY